MKKRVLSGMRPTGRLHLGNYLGGVKGMLALQNDPDYETYYVVVDLHAITTPYDPATLPQTTREVVKDYIACGLDPEKSALMIQSHLADLITQLAFYFSSVVSVARMQHLPTFKEKVKQYPDNVTMALLNYPVLMAADILMYKAGLVPVGVDQEPHLEIAREVARKMNATYGTDFPEPQRFATQGQYVPSLSGEGKMSKSVEGSYISLSDDLNTIRKRLASAPSDSGQGSSMPQNGSVANLLTLVELIQGAKRRKQYEALYLSSGIRYRDLKEELAEAIYAELQPIQEKRRQLAENPEYIENILQNGAQRSREVASQTLNEVRQKLGFH